MCGTGELRDIPIEDVERWATVEGNPDNQLGVHAVMLGVNRPLLKQMTIVDTPGVGGLDSGHGALAIEAAASADALIFVIDPSAPISGPELAFLSSASEKVDNVTVVLTKTDAYEHWRSHLETARHRVAESLVRVGGIPIFPVSNTQAMDDEDRGESGIDDIEAHLLAEIEGRTDVLRLANILRVADSCLVELIRGLSAQRAALAAGTNALAVLESERTRLKTVGADGKQLMRDLDDGFRNLSLDRADALNRGMRDIRTSYDERVGTVRGDELSALPAQLVSDVTALADRLTEVARERLMTLAEDLIGQVDSTVPELASLELLEHKQFAEHVSLDTPRKRAANRVERLSTLVSFSSGRSVGSLAASLPLIALGGTPFIIAGLGLGAVFAFHMHKGRSDVTRQNDFRAWMREQLAEAERQLNNDFSRAMIPVGHELRTALTERIDLRRSEIAEMISECEATSASAVSNQKSQHEAIERRLVDVRAVRLRGEALRVNLLGVSDSVDGGQ